MAMNSLWRKSSFASIVTARANMQQIRTTYVVERRNPAPLRKPHKNSSLRSRHFVYETLEDNIPKPQRMLNILLRKYVDSVGQPGELVSVKEQFGRFLIMTEKAVYSTQENVKKYAKDMSEQPTFSSKYAATTLDLLSKFVLNISMNRETPWTLEPWHVRAAFRKAGVHVPESAITMPENVIPGPDLALEGKEFYVTVTINGREKAIVRCRVHHWATNLAEKLPRVRDHWKFPAETIFSEDRQITKTLPEMIPPVLEEDDGYVPPTRRTTSRRR